MRFGVEVLDHDFEASEVLATVEKNIERYGIEEILFWGGGTILTQAVEAPGYPKYATMGKEETAGRFREWLKR
ncbi:MAG: hypothetical protein ACLFUS_17465 [Candidatus Sumerlaeia bacterium]